MAKPECKAKIIPYKTVLEKIQWFSDHGFPEPYDSDYGSSYDAWDILAELKPYLNNLSVDTSSQIQKIMCKLEPPREKPGREELLNAFRKAAKECPIKLDEPLPEAFAEYDPTARRKKLSEERERREKQAQEEFETLSNIVFDGMLDEFVKCECKR